MRIESIEQFGWRYRFNDEVEIATGGGILVDGKRIADDYMSAVPTLSRDLICKASRILKIDKGNGEFRYCYSPNDLYKETLKGYLPELESMLDAADTRGMMHAFRSNYNAVTNAKAHIGYNYSAKFDLKDFFNSIPSHLVEMVVSGKLKRDCLIGGKPVQGLPTSPLIANLALLPVGYAIQDALEEAFGDGIRITIYADDITVSFDNRMDFVPIRDIIYSKLKAEGIKINYRKTKLKFGHKDHMRRIICGVSVGRHKVYRTRAIKRKIQKAFYTEDLETAFGLVEWARCREPRSRSKHGAY